MIDATKAATPFDYDAVEFDGVADAEKKRGATKEHDLEILRRVGDLFREQIIAPSASGRAPDDRTVMLRLVIFLELLSPCSGTTLTSIACQYNVTRAYACKVAKEISARLGLRASWQRVNAREVYAQRAKAVHAGKWKATDKWERRKIREHRSTTTATSAAERRDAKRSYARLVAAAKLDAWLAELRTAYGRRGYTPRVPS